MFATDLVSAKLNMLEQNISITSEIPPQTLYILQLHFLPGVCLLYTESLMLPSSHGFRFPHESHARIKYFLQNSPNFVFHLYIYIHIYMFHIYEC